MTKKQKEVQEAKEKLLSMLKPGMTVYTILRRVSASGMQRKISLMVIGSDGRSTFPLWLNWSASILLGRRIDRKDGHDGIIIKGCGMDMGFALVSNLAEALYCDYKALRQEWL